MLSNLFYYYKSRMDLGKVDPAWPAYFQLPKYYIFITIYLHTEETPKSQS
jgi:hypothetical protein